jgi:phage-related protein
MSDEPNIGHDGLHVEDGAGPGEPADVDLEPTGPPADPPGDDEGPGDDGGGSGTGGVGGRLGRPGWGDLYELRASSENVIIPLPHFLWIPDYTAQAKVEPRVSKVEFGDGYAQRMGRGVNTMLETLSLTFSGRTDGETELILAFLKDRGGFEPFTATIGVGPNPPTKKYVTEGEWTRTWDAYSDNTITVTFKEVP